MWLVASVAHTKQTRTARDLAEDIGLAYKTVLLWLHKMRAEIALFAATLTLGGEVEIDGAKDGGSVRPKNMKKTRKDLRKIPYRANDRAHSVVAARERGGGPIRTWVAKEESDARPFLMKAIEPGSVLFTDKAAGWKPTRGKFKLFQIDHSQAYYTPEACTNQVETLWAQMRVNGRVHRSIARNYLDLYAAEVAWTLGKGKKAVGVAFGELMGWMSRSGRSPLAGYFQGRKRFLPVCKPDGTFAEWKPAPRRGRADFIKTGDKPIEFKPRSTRDKSWREGWTFLTADAFLDRPEAVPNGSGVYALFARDAAGFLSGSGFVEESVLPLWRHEGAQHLYTGESYGIQGRLQEHLVGSIRGSPLRETLLALQFHLGLLPRAPAEEERALVEGNLSDWMRRNLVIGYKPCGYVRDMERIILSATASPMNLVRPNPSEFTKVLQERRRSFREQVTQGWPEVIRPAIPRRRR